MSDLVQLISGAAWLPLLVEIAVKATLILALAALASALLWRASAAVRHMVWVVGIAGVLMLPVLSALVPAWELPFLAETAATVAPSPRLESPSIVATPSATWAAEPSQRLDGARAVRSAGAWLLDLAGAAAVAGMLVGLLWLTAGFWGVTRLGRRAEVVQDPEWLRVAQQAAERLSLRRPVLLLRSHGAPMPATWGLLWPSVILPTSADEWPEDRRRAVLVHELAHVKRFDCLTQALAQLACILLWWHPAVWYAARRLRIERERACDDLVLGTGTRASDYAAHLLEIARLHRSMRLAAPALVSMAKPSQLESRLLSVLDGATRRAAPSTGALVLAAAAGLLVVGPLAAARPAPAEAALNAPGAAHPSAPPPGAPAGGALAAGDTLPRPDPLRELIALRSVGMDSAYVAGLRAVGYRELSIEQLIEMKAVGVTARWAKEMNAAGYGRLTPEQLASLQAVGVTAAYIDELRRHGYQGLSLEEIGDLHAVGVSGSYIEEMNAAGLGRLTPQQLEDLKSVGITAGYIRELTAAGIGPLSPEQLIQRQTGYD